MFIDVAVCAVESQIPIKLKPNSYKYSNLHSFYVYLCIFYVSVYVRTVGVRIRFPFNEINFYQFHAVSHIQQGRQREPSIKTLRSPLSAEFQRHCVLSSRIQRRALPRHQSEEKEILIKVNISSPRVGIESKTNRFYSHFVPLRHDWPQINNYLIILFPRPWQRKSAILSSFIQHATFSIQREVY